MAGPQRYAARYYDGRTARPQDVEIEITDAGIAIYRRPGIFIASWQAARLVLAEKPRRGEPLRIGLEGTTARLIVDDREALEALLAAAPGAARSVRTSRRAVLRVAAWIAAAGAAAAAIVLVLIPLLSAQLARQTPQAIKLRIGDAVLARVTDLVAYLPGEDHKARYCTGSPGLAILQRLASRITERMDDPPALRLVAIDANLVNAFALPGGYVVVTRGLLNMAESAEEVAGVLAHEIGHVAHDHPTQAIFRSTAVSLLISAVIGDVTGGVLIGAVAEWTLNNSYSRSAEREADAFAVARLNAAGIDGRGLERFFARIAEKEGKDGGKDDALDFLSTHPRTAERMAYIRENARAEGRALTETAWRQLRDACARTQADPPAFPTVGGR